MRGAEGTAPESATRGGSTERLRGFIGLAPCSARPGQRRRPRRPKPGCAQSRRPKRGLRRPPSPFRETRTQDPTRKATSLKVFDPKAPAAQWRRRGKGMREERTLSLAAVTETRGDAHKSGGRGTQGEVGKGGRGKERRHRRRGDPRRARAPRARGVASCRAAAKGCRTYC